MKKDELNSTLARIQGINIQNYLTDDTEELGMNPTILIQVVDDEFEFGYWDYFYKTNANNPNWYKEFKKEFDNYLKEFEEQFDEDDEEKNTITEIKVFVCFYDSLSDSKPYGYWDCLDIIPNYYYD